MDIMEGETAGIFGDSGSGKSTIGQILAGLIPQTSGVIEYDGSKAAMPYIMSNRYDRTPPARFLSAEKLLLPAAGFCCRNSFSAKGAGLGVPGLYIH
ncbi:MAG: ATP-binding cassette domain-containing protein [Synergistaceae bacterium]|nr:ATP-binding cassette domain-containing protein [Synergistaceae bacterium]